MIPAAIKQIFNPIAELVVPKGIPTKEAKPEMEVHPVTVEAKIRMTIVYNLVFTIVQNCKHLFVLFIAFKLLSPDYLLKI